MQLRETDLSEFDDLITKLMEQRPELTRKDIDDQIKLKKEKIGAGYLTDQGALFLIASDLGVTLSEPLKVEMSLKDLYAGAKEISLETRVLNISPAKQYSRKDGSPFFLRTMTVYDKNSTASVKLWDEKANIEGLENLKPGNLVKIIKAYVKSDLNGSPTINIGSGSTIQQSDDTSEIPTIDSITKNASEIQADQKDIVVSGTLDGTINTMQFTNSRGQPGKALRMRIKGSDGKSVRVVMWGHDESNLPKVISQGTKVRLLGVKIRQGNDGLEIHGNESTMIEISGQNEIEPIITRIISKTKNDAGKFLVLGVDKKKNIFSITDATNATAVFQEGDIIEFMPSKIVGNSIMLDSDSFVRKLDNTESVPTISELRTKIRDVKVDGNYCIEAIILKAPERREVQTKNGENILLAEMFVEDDTGQIWVKGWRNQARIVEGCSIGEIVSITSLNSKAGLEGRIELFLTPFSKITKRN